jgi:hypothetical protein
MFHPILLKSINLLTAISMLAQPILAAIPPEMVRAASAEVETRAADPVAPDLASVDSDPLTATMPAPAVGPRAGFSQQSSPYDDEPVYHVMAYKLLRTRNFTDASPQWEDITGALAGYAFSDLYLE